MIWYIRIALSEPGSQCEQGELSSMCDGVQK